MSTKNTPRTDAATKTTDWFTGEPVVVADFARSLERELDEARAEIAALREKIENQAHELTRLMRAHKRAHQEIYQKTKRFTELAKYEDIVRNVRKLTAAQNSEATIEAVQRLVAASGQNQDEIAGGIESWSNGCEYSCTLWRLPDRVWWEEPGRSVDKRVMERFLMLGHQGYEVMDRDKAEEHIRRWSGEPDFEINLAEIAKTMRIHAKPMED